MFLVIARSMSTKDIIECLDNCLTAALTNQLKECNESVVNHFMSAYVQVLDERREYND